MLSYELMREAYAGTGVGLNGLGAWAEGEVAGWPGLADAIADAFPSVPIEVWVFGKVTTAEAFRSLTGRALPDNAAAPGGRIVNPSPGWHALEQIRQRRSAGETLDKAAVDAIVGQGGPGKI
ncbi:hypothetical protein, partial [Roseibium sp. RKSG952]|uniref:hypothetical protein n=1 Tax=Roseibium sp. RKSG952 TaxID=2529384 RepID=UPI0012BD0E40